MIRAKFGSALGSKTYHAQVNALLRKVLAHNLCCLVQAFYELGLDAQFLADGLDARRGPAGGPWYVSV